MQTGALLFCGAVSTKTLIDMSDKTEFVKAYFPVWWPHGKNCMVPLIGTTVLSNIAAWYFTKDWRFLVSGGFCASVGFYTGLFMKEDSIDPLMKSEDATDDDIQTFVKKFCRKHHPRTLLALTGLAVSIWAAVTELKK